MTCPFCPGHYTLAQGEDGYFITHTIPYCEKFGNEDPLVYVRNARVAKIGRLPDDDEWPVTGGGHE
jgi:hypothetical protein